MEQLVRIFGRENVYVELQRHHEREEEWRNQAAIRIARSLKLPVLATNGVRYATSYHREILDVLTAVRHHTDLDRAGRLLALNSQRHLRSAREMAHLFHDVPGAVENTIELSSRLNFELNDLGYEFPRYPVPDGETMDSFLGKRVAEGVARLCCAKKANGCEKILHQRRFVRWIQKSGLSPTTAAPALPSESIRWPTGVPNCGTREFCQS